ncbi:MAG TPA: hypothetical protein IAB06_06605 [Candidatus Avacidaminococcus intestinavium]|uniref:ATPase n=1 Tax=Candidatus Avacidaminococcus intestinavium TaxID=2840684 RepID=A0A9D1SLV1_9FIRM|nr:hypothetical protein [Candidatus Avacidaminococcus intestinavium]
MELDKILDEMESLILEASHLPFSEKIIIEEGDLSLIMDRLREAVPLEVKKAHDLLDEQMNIIKNSRAEADRIVEQAKAEAERIVELAKAEAERIVRSEEIVKMAEEKAQNILNDTKQYDNDMRAAADAYAEKMHRESINYATDVFDYLEQNLKNTLEIVQANRAPLNAGQTEVSEEDE